MRWCHSQAGWTTHNGLWTVLASAAQEHIPQSPVLTGSEQQDIVTLEMLSDPKFTRTYLDMQVFDHIETLRQFLQETTTGQDPALRTFAQEQLPTLVQHLDSAVALDLAGVDSHRLLPR